MWYKSHISVLSVSFMTRKLLLFLKKHISIVEVRSSISVVILIKMDDREIEFRVAASVRISRTGLCTTKPSHGAFSIPQA
jgi:hypothetical protein